MSKEHPNRRAGRQVGKPKQSRNSLPIKNQIGQEKKPQCESCGVVEGGVIYHERLSDFRGHKICSWCSIRWLELEESRGRIVEFMEFTTGKDKNFKGDSKPFTSQGKPLDLAYSALKSDARV